MRYLLLQDEYLYFKNEAYDFILSFFCTRQVSPQNTRPEGRFTSTSHLVRILIYACEPRPVIRRVGVRFAQFDMND